MGFLRRGIKDGVPAQAEVLAIGPTWAGARQTGRRDVPSALDLLVHAPGREPYRVTHECTVPWDRTPLVGHRIPVVASAAEPERLRIDWNQMPSLTDAALRSAAAARRGDAAGAAEALGFRLVEPGDPGA